jgi:hypothetical protein
MKAHRATSHLSHIRCMHIPAANGTYISLQLHSSRWPILFAAGFQKLLFMTAYKAGVCHSVAWLQDIHTILVFNSCRFHCIRIPITGISILRWMFAYTYFLFILWLLSVSHTIFIYLTVPGLFYTIWIAQLMVGWSWIITGKILKGIVEVKFGVLSWHFPRE